MLCISLRVIYFQILHIVLLLFNSMCSVLMHILDCVFHHHYSKKNPKIILHNKSPSAFFSLLVWSQALFSPGLSSAQQSPVTNFNFFFSVGLKITRCLDRRWSYRTATAQRRKDRHRQQTEHLTLDNDLKEVEKDNVFSPVNSPPRLLLSPLFSNVALCYKHVFIFSACLMLSYFLFCSLTEFLLAFFLDVFSSFFSCACCLSVFFSILLSCFCPVLSFRSCVLCRLVGAWVVSSSSSSSAGGGLCEPAELHGILGVGQCVPSTYQTT